MASHADAAGDGPDSDPEYESDPEDAVLPLMRRRREASDEEEEGEEEEQDTGYAVAVGSDGDSEGQGAAEVYDDEEYSEDGEYDDFEGESLAYGDVRATFVAAGGDVGKSFLRAGVEVEEVDQIVHGDEGEKGEDDAEKKEKEPFAVPTAGAFYMHDDRFQENGRGRRPRRIFSGRKPWNPKEDRAWVHDKFEEMNIRETNYGQGTQSSRGRSRGRSRGQGRRRAPSTGHGYFRGNKYRGYSHDDIIQNSTPKVIRGRGSRGYQPRWRAVGERHEKQENETKKQENNDSTTRTDKQYPCTLEVWKEPSIPRKQTFSSNLNSASPPFYPSSSNKEFRAAQKWDSDAQSSSTPASQSHFAMREMVTVGRGRLNVGVSAQPNDSSRTQTSRRPTVRPALGVFMEPPLPQHSSPGQNVSEPVATSTSSIEEKGLMGSRSAANGTVKNSNHGEVAPLLYRGAHVLGAPGSFSVAPGEQGFPGAPALLPVVQFGGHHGGLSVPALGMALPGYMAQPPIGMGSSEMTWLPLFGGAGRPLGTPYPPYIALDGRFHPQPARQSSPSASSRDISTAAHKSPQSAEVANEEPVQCQNKPRRYSEMNFGH